jgi:RimJ/RimL family protein N-acetyltransferase
MPPRANLDGRYVRLEPQTLAAHGDDLWEAFSAEPTGADWTYRFIGPFNDRSEFDEVLRADEHSRTNLFFAYIDLETGKALGNGSFMTIDRAAGSIEVGAIMFSRALQRTRAATEAIYLHMAWAFEHGYRRFEWTCNATNAASMGAAERFGFSFEAIFRQAHVAKGLNRDTATFSITDQDWPTIKAAFETWLAPGNFDSHGLQHQSLRTLTAPSVHARATPVDRGQRNDLDQPVDYPVPAWTPPPRPSRITIEGSYCRLEPLAVEHADALFAAHSRDAHGRNWTYMPVGPFDGPESYRAWLWDAAISPDPLQYAIVTKDGPVGTASLLRINPQSGSIEVGYIAFSPLLQRTRAATEAMYMMMRWAFEAGYRRYEWKCNALNAPSRRAAQRLGLSFEGVFRQCQIVKGANRDTAWYAAIDSEWPALRTAFETWLDASNFDADGQQLQSLSDLTRPILVKAG